MRIGRILLYPIKSTRGIQVDVCDLDAFGLALDRRWMVVDAGGRAVTQRERPSLALVRTRLDGDRLVVSASDHQDLVLPIQPRAEGELEVEVWEDTFAAGLVGGGGSEWFSEYLEMPCRLTYMPERIVRPVDRRYGVEGDRVSFTDGYPLLLIGAASLEDLNRRLETSVPMDRFRPNLVVLGSDAFAEDGWKRLTIGSGTYRVAKPCARCAVTTIDQQTGARGAEPLRTLATYRKVDGMILFGQSLLHDAPGVVRVGDPVEVLEARA